MAIPPLTVKLGGHRVLKFGLYSVYPSWQLILTKFLPRGRDMAGPTIFGAHNFLFCSNLHVPAFPANIRHKADL